MFKPQKLYKIIAIGMQKDKEWFISAIHSFGKMHIEDLSDKIKNDNKYGLLFSDKPLREHDALSHLLLRINFLLEIHDKHVGKTEIKHVEPIDKHFSLRQVNKNTALDLAIYEQKIIALDKEIKHLNDLIAKKKEEIEKLELYDLKGNFRNLLKSKVTSTVIGKVLKNDFHNFKLPAKVKKHIVLIKKEISDNSFSLVAIYSKKFEVEMQKFFSEIKLEKENLNISIDSDADNLIGVLIDEIYKLKTERGIFLEKLKRFFLKYYGNILSLKKLIMTAKERAEISTSFGSTQKTFYIESYVPVKDFNKLRIMIGKRHIILKKEEAKDAPIILNNFPYVKSFEKITTMFGYPSYDSIDPTFFISIFFPFFFGFMLSDVGYGLMLLIFSIIGYFYFKRSEVAKDLLVIFGSSALWTIGFGFAFGSFFGKLVSIPALWVDPFQSSILILTVSIIIGFVHINLGLLLSSIDLISKGKFKIFFLESGSLYFLQGAILAFILGFKSLGYILLVFSIVLLIIKSSLFGLMEITGFLGLILSYARILALALATGGIALAINIISEQVHSLGIIGVILSPLIIIGGHTFNFLLNIIGSSIHAARLHFVEFFSVFFKEGGQKFKPFRIKEE